MIWSSVQLPMPVSLSGVMLLEYTVPNGPSYRRPPALTGSFGLVWQPQPPVAPNTDLPRSISAGVGEAADAGMPEAAMATATSRQRRAHRMKCLLNSEVVRRVPEPWCLAAYHPAGNRIDAVFQSIV